MKEFITDPSAYLILSIILMILFYRQRGARHELTENAVIRKRYNFFIGTSILFFVLTLGFGFFSYFTVSEDVEFEKTYFLLFGMLCSFNLSGLISFAIGLQRSDRYANRRYHN